jgi:hypothetical protein
MVQRSARTRSGLRVGSTRTQTSSLRFAPAVQAGQLPPTDADHGPPFAARSALGRKQKWIRTLPNPRLAPIDPPHYSSPLATRLRQRFQARAWTPVASIHRSSDAAQRVRRGGANNPSCFAIDSSSLIRALAARCSVRMALVSSPCVVLAAAQRSRPCGVRGPVLLPPWNLHTRFPRMAGARHCLPVRFERA